jgi:hypothetical protein
MKRFKVICDQGHLLLVTVFDYVQHLTGMASIPGGGVVLAPIIILKNLQHLRELPNYDTHFLFAISTNRWMTKDLWVYNMLIFCAQISHYRLSLLLALRDEHVLLIIDGHKTRLSLLAALIFEMNGLNVLVLPPRSSHLLQIFDLSPASPIKTAFKKELNKRLSEISPARPGEKMQRIQIALIEDITTWDERIILRLSHAPPFLQQNHTRNHDSRKLARPFLHTTGQDSFLIVRYVWISLQTIPNRFQVFANEKAPNQSKTTRGPK